MRAPSSLSPASPPDRRLARTGARGRFVAVAALIGAAAAVVARALVPAAGEAASLLPCTVMLAVVAIGLPSLRSAHPHARLGSANVVTLVRAGIVGVLAVALTLPRDAAADPALAWGLVGLAVTGLALDGVDGWLARRAGLASVFGARFDMEVDAALAAALCLLAILSGKAGLWLLPLGFLRYAWVAAGSVLPWLGGPLPDRLRRKAICVAQIAVLIALIAPVIDSPLSDGLAIAGTLALLWSFGADALWRWRHRG